MDELLKEMFLRFGREICDDKFMVKLGREWEYTTYADYLEPVRVDIPKDEAHKYFPHYYRLTEKAIKYLGKRYGTK